MKASLYKTLVLLPESEYKLLQEEKNKPTVNKREEDCPSSSLNSHKVSEINIYNGGNGKPCQQNMEDVRPSSKNRQAGAEGDVSNDLRMHSNSKWETASQGENANFLHENSQRAVNENFQEARELPSLNPSPPDESQVENEMVEEMSVDNDSTFIASRPSFDSSPKRKKSQGKRGVGSAANLRKKRRFKPANDIIPQVVYPPQTDKSKPINKKLENVQNDEKRKKNPVRLRKNDQMAESKQGRSNLKRKRASRDVNEGSKKMKLNLKREAGEPIDAPSAKKVKLGKQEKLLQGSDHKILSSYDFNPRGRKRKIIFENEAHKKIRLGDSEPLRGKKRKIDLEKKVAKKPRLTSNAYRGKKRVLSDANSHQPASKKVKLDMHYLW